MFFFYSVLFMVSLSSWQLSGMLSSSRASVENTEVSMNVLVFVGCHQSFYELIQTAIQFCIKVPHFSHICIVLNFFAVFLPPIVLYHSYLYLAFPLQLLKIMGHYLFDSVQGLKWASHLVLIRSEISSMFSNQSWLFLLMGSMVFSVKSIMFQSVVHFYIFCINRICC